MKKLGFIAVLLCMAAMPAHANSLFASVEQRTALMKEQLAGNQSYDAYLAKEFARIALEEKDQHDIDVARYFMGLAETHASKAGGK
ncbi:MAG: hypothetical protein AUJ56_11005 [Zetaproteobacteria bacterium CG1_02_49_23]|nr:MAG: hypothetical protein AUJ56_11005 [Zetaproteobacteria bacterium CG1_02_49_23]